MPLVKHHARSDRSVVAYDWQSLPKDALVVDVGGGVGTVSLVLAKTFSNMKIVIQDLPKVVEDGLKVNSSYSI